MADWIPIASTLDQNGAFAALANLPNAAALKPVPLAAGRTPFEAFSENEMVLDFSMAMQLGVAAAFDASAAFKTRTISHEVAVFSEQDTTTPAGGLILGTTWGASIRTRIDVTNFDSKVSLSLGAVAAAASIGLVSASYTIEGIGIADPSILAMLPGPGRFDEGTRKKIFEAINMVKNDFLLPKKGISSVPFRILVSNPSLHFASPLARARAQLFAMRQLRDGLTENAALSRAGTLSLNKAAVTAAYREWAGIQSPATAPSGAVRKRAETWLEDIDLD
jgi:hypothetical protein